MAPQVAPESPSAISRLESLPLYLNLEICEYLARSWPRNRDLFAFSLASKTCSSIADRERFRLIQVSILNPSKLRYDVDEWRQILDSGSRFKFVHTIKISGIKMSAEADGNNWGRALRYNPLFPGPSWHPEEWKEMEEREIFDDLEVTMSCKWFELPESPSNQRWRDEAWEPLVQLCRALPALKDLVYAVQEQIPPTLLAELHENHPDARLHVHHFRLRSLQYFNPAHQDIDPHDVALATSPCLHSVVGTVAPYTTTGKVDHNGEALIDMIGGLAPKLKNVGFVKSQREFSRSRLFGTVPRPQWQGFRIPGKSFKKSSKGSIHNLVLAGGEGASAESLRNWDQRTDFHKLQTLRIQGYIGMQAVSQLTQFSQVGAFDALSSLSLSLRIFFGEPGADLDPATAELLRALRRPLQSLALRGSIGDETFDAVMEGHARSLRNLKFLQNEQASADEFRICVGHVERLSQRCHQLRELELMLLRMQGNSEEVAIYQLLGRLPQLEHLTLRLDCIVEQSLGLVPEDSVNGPVGNTYDLGYMGTVSRDALHDVLKNTAIDSTLASRIFQLSSGTNRSLRSLLLCPCELNSTVFVGQWLRWIGRSWIVWNGSGEKLELRDLDGGEIDEGYEEGDDKMMRIVDREGDKIKPAWDAVWPIRSQRWWNDWSSCPLVEEADI